MAAVDSFILLLNQASSDLKQCQVTITNVLAIVGAWYTLRLTIKFGSYILECGKYLRISLKRTNLVRQYGRWAVVTGCTRGIGKAFAHNLAAKGLNIILVSRDKQSLLEESRLIESMYGVHTISIQQDFSAGDKSTLKQFHDLARSLDVGILINNVGVHYDYPHAFHQLQEERLHALVQVNMAATVTMTHAVLAGMMTRKRGLILNMSSSAGLVPIPLISLYSATKAFVDHFSQTLYYEYADKNIHVQSLVPMYIATRMTEYSDSLRAFGLFTPTPETYVRHAIRTFGHYRCHTGYVPHSIQKWIMMSIPRIISIMFGHWMQAQLQLEGERSFKKSN